MLEYENCEREYFCATATFLSVNCCELQIDTDDRILNEIGKEQTAVGL
jgi:hypothetical protein